MANRFPAVLFATALFVAITAEAQEEAAGGKPRVGYVLAGSFESPDLSKTPDGAERTLLVPHYEWDYGVRAFTHETWQEQGMEWESFEAASASVADAIVRALEPEVVRNDKGVVEYLLVESEDPFVTGILLSSELLPKFRDLLGDRIHAVAIDRNIVFLFPGVGGRLSSYGKSIVEDYEAARFPVSLEVFEIDENGCRAVGELER